MGALADIYDVERLGVDTSDTLLVEALLDSVSAAVRDAAGTPITLTEVTVTREGTWDQNLVLPSALIREVTEVVVDGHTVEDWRRRGNRLYRPQGWGSSHSDVTVTFTHGYDKPPADITKMVATFVAAGLNEAEYGAGSTRGLTSARIDDAMESYARGDDEIVDLTELPDRVKAALAERFSGAASVSRSL